MKDRLNPVKQLGWACSSITCSIRCLCRL